MSGSTWEMNGRGCLPPGVWIHLPLGDLGHMVWKGVRRRLRLVLAGGHASAWISPFWRGPAPGAQRYQAAFTSAHRFFIPPKLSCLTSNIPCPPTSKLDDSPMKVSLWNVHDGLRMTPNPHLTCLYLFSSINSYTMVNLLVVLGSSLSQGCEN